MRPCPGSLIAGTGPCSSFAIKGITVSKSALHRTLVGRARHLRRNLATRVRADPLQMRMNTILNQSPVARAFEKLDADGRKKASFLDDRIVGAGQLRAETLSSDRPLAHRHDRRSRSRHRSDAGGNPVVSRPVQATAGIAAGLAIGIVASLLGVDIKLVGSLTS